MPTADELQVAKDKYGEAVKQLRSLKDAASRLSEAASSYSNSLGEACQALNACPKTDMASWGADLAAVLAPIEQWDPRHLMVTIGELVGRANTSSDAGQQVTEALNRVAPS